MKIKTLTFIRRMQKRFLFLLFILFLTGITFSQEKNQRSDEMKKQEIYKEIEQTLGLVPTFFKLVPDRSLELEWKLFKTLQLEDSPIPNKYRELIGVAISAVTKCRYCSYFHTEVAKLFGSTNEEIEDAVHYAKSSAGWSAYLNGMQVDYDQFRNELNQSIKYIKAQSNK